MLQREVEVLVWLMQIPYIPVWRWFNIQLCNSGAASLKLKFLYKNEGHLLNLKVQFTKENDSMCIQLHNYAQDI